MAVALAGLAVEVAPTGVQATTVRHRRHSDGAREHERNQDHSHRLSHPNGAKGDAGATSQVKATKVAAPRLYVTGAARPAVIMGSRNRVRRWCRCENPPSDFLNSCRSVTWPQPDRRLAIAAECHRTRIERADSSSRRSRDRDRD